MPPKKNAQKMPFELKEYRQRLSRVRKGMEAAGAEVMLVTAPENIYYLLGYHTVGYFSFQVLIVSLDRDPIMLARGLNTTQVENDSWIKTIEGYGDTDDPNDALVRVLDKHGLLNKRIGNQDNAFFFTVAQYKKLVARLGREPVDCSGVVEKVRLIKSPQEIAYMKKAGKCAAAAIDACLDWIVPGNTENDVAAALHDGLISAGSEYLGHPPLVVTGPAAGVGMETWKRRKIKKNDVFFIENGGTFNRYNVGLSRTVIVGKPGQKWIDMYDACRDGFMKSAKAMKPGATSHDVDKACRDHIRSQGYPFDKRVGYSIGIGFPPDWGEGRTASINQDDPMVLKPGMVFHMVPNLRIYGEGAVMFSETWAVTDKGSECLTRYGRDLMFR